MPSESDFIPGLMVIIGGKPHRAVLSPIAEDAVDVAGGAVLLIHGGRMHRMVAVPFAVGSIMAGAPTLDDDEWPGDDDIPAPRPSVLRDAEFTKPITTE